MTFRPHRYLIAAVVALTATSIFGAGAGAASASPAHARTTPKYTVTVHGIDAAGDPDTGDYVILANVNNPKAFGDTEDAQGTFASGVATFKVPAGTYWAVGIFNAGFSWGGPDPSAAHRLALHHAAPDRRAAAREPSQMVVLPQFAVSADTAVTANAKTATSQVRFSTPLPATLQSVQANAERISAGGQKLEVSVNGGPPEGGLFVTPISHKPADGTIDDITGAQLFSPASAAAPYQYYLIIRSPSGTIPPQSFRISAASLATEHENLYSGAAGSGSFSALGYLPAEIGYPLDSFSVPDLSVPGHDTAYLSAVGGAALWHNNYTQVYPFTAGQMDWAVTYRPGQVATVNWNAYPLHTAPNVNPLGAAAGNMIVSANRSGNSLTLAFMPFSDNVYGHLGSGYFPGKVGTVSGTYQIQQNGTTIASGNALDSAGIPSGEFYHQVTLSSKPSVVSFTLTAKRTGTDFPLSTATSTTWTWRTAPKPGATVPDYWYCSLSSNHNCAVQPLPILSYNVGGLALNGTTTPGTQSLGVSVGHLQLAAAQKITNVSVQASFNDGKTWTTASVTGQGGSYHARFAAPASSNVTLRVTATDAAGGKVSDTINRAYATAS
ncbi:MAG TPA: hypothetical protein VGH27_18545 [Streptosporangiaceae bacterium]